jgi:hypothetical protein
MDFYTPQPPIAHRPDIRNSSAAFPLYRKKYYLWGNFIKMTTAEQLKNLQEREQTLRRCL